MLSQLLSNRVEKTPATEVSADRYQFLTLAEAEPDLGVPASNGYILSSTTAGVRSWLNPATNLTAPGSNTQVIFNNSGVLAAATGLVYDIATGRVGIGTVSPSSKLDVAGDIKINSNVNLNSESITLTTTSKTQIASFSTSGFRSGKLIVQAYDSVTGEVQISELLVAHNGTTASATEYGVVYTGSSSIVTYDVDISAGNVRLMATRTTTNSTQYKISETLMVA